MNWLIGRPLVHALAVALLPLAAAAQEPTTITEPQPNERHQLLSLDKNTFIGFRVGWVAKELVTSRGGRTIHEDLWGNPDKMMQGYHFGVNVQRNVWRGLGFRTGLNYECYISVNHVVKDAGFRRFVEHDLYLPIHVSLHMTPFKNFSITPYAGIGFNWAINGIFKTYEDVPVQLYYSYGNGLVETMVDNAIHNYYRQPVYRYDYNNYSPHHWNVQAEVGVSAKFKKAELSFTYSFGVNRHNIYVDAATRQNKMTATIGVLLNVKKKGKQNGTGNKKKERTGNSTGNTFN